MLSFPISFCLIFFYCNTVIYLGIKCSNTKSYHQCDHTSTSFPTTTLACLFVGTNKLTLYCLLQQMQMDLSKFGSIGVFFVFIFESHLIVLRDYS